MKTKTNIVSYEVAELLKKVGFDEDVYFNIYPDGTLTSNGFLCNYNKTDESPFSAPTYSEVVDWLLDKFGFFIEIDYIRMTYNFGKKYKYYVIDTTDENGFGGDLIIRSEESYETRNEAIEHALKKLLKKMLSLKEKEKEVEDASFKISDAQINVKN